METSTSIAQEYYRLQELWQEIDTNPEWRLTIWVASYNDVDILDKFMEIERSPLGVFDDIFFRFETPYQDDYIAFEKALWEEYVSWFTEKPDPSLDILQALKNDGLMKSDYTPDTTLEPTAANLWKEMLRFKSCIEGMEEDRFCLYFPPTLPYGPKLSGWFSSVLDEGVPEGIRLVTIDYADKRKVKLQPSSKVMLLTPELNMPEAIRNDMDKDSDSYDTVSAETLFRKQVRVVMDCTLKKDSRLMDRETGLLLSLSKETGCIPVQITALMIAAQAYFSINNTDKCDYYADEAIKGSEELMQAADPAGYPVWKAAILLKAAVLAGKKERRKAIEYYIRLAEEAIEQTDAFMTMEGYRMSAHLYYELIETDMALENALLALSAGAYLEKEVRRQSTFLHAATLALLLIRKEGSYDKLEIMEEQLQEWLGDDWRSLVETEDMQKVKKRRKASIFS